MGRFGAKNGESFGWFSWKYLLYFSEQMFYHIDMGKDAQERKKETMVKQRRKESDRNRQKGERNMREAGMARRLLQEELREKKRLASSGRRKCVHSGRVRVRMMSDALSEQEWARMNGHIRIYQLGRPLTRRQYLALPEDLRRIYVKLLRDKHGATRQQVRQLVGEDLGLRFGTGDARRWEAFLARGKR